MRRFVKSYGRMDCFFGGSNVIFIDYREREMCVVGGGIAWIEAESG